MPAPRAGGESRRRALDGVRGRAQLVVTDLAMPGHDGCWLLRQVRAHTGAADVRAVAVTAFTERYVRDQVLAAGFDAFVPKPIDPETLCVELHRVLTEGRLET